ncbi:hypothetical protein C8F04DRAFT_1193710 [Mycena alexandri]|uniref:Uncharacterized protein n=1 Tax=Mycena alexandri TaxID=1745969 RepID=A0AAD6S921_9AGAR|nr:hypothetical protein C8F04DRAFT_1193710 [Mycena alexandri]
MSKNPAFVTSANKDAPAICGLHNEHLGHLTPSSAVRYPYLTSLSGPEPANLLGSGETPRGSDVRLLMCSTAISALLGTLLNSTSVFAPQTLAPSFDVAALFIGQSVHSSHCKSCTRLNRANTEIPGAVSSSTLFTAHAPEATSIVSTNMCAFLEVKANVGLQVHWRLFYHSSALFEYFKSLHRCRGFQVSRFNYCSTCAGMILTVFAFDADDFEAPPPPAPEVYPTSARTTYRVGYFNESPDADPSRSGLCPAMVDQFCFIVIPRMHWLRVAVKSSNTILKSSIVPQFKLIKVCQDFNALIPITSDGSIKLSELNTLAVECVATVGTLKLSVRLTRPRVRFLLNNTQPECRDTLYAK